MKKFYTNWRFIVLFLCVIAVCFLATFSIINKSMKESNVEKEFWEESSDSEEVSQNTKQQEQKNIEKDKQINTKSTNQLNTEKQENLNTKNTKLQDTEKKDQLNTKKQERLDAKKNKQYKKNKDKLKSTPKPKTDSTKSKNTSVALDIVYLFSEYNKNKATADEKYKDKRFGISGTVVNIDTAPTGRSVIVLQGKDSDRVVSCEFLKNAATDIEVIKKGDSITVRGLCKGINDNTIVFRKCKIAK